MFNKLHTVTSYLRHFMQATRKGHGVHSPFAYELCEEVFYNKAVFYDFTRLKEIRKEIATNSGTVEVRDLGAASRAFAGSHRKISAIATKGVSNAAQSELLYRLINYLQLRYCIELGTSLGINSLYMALAARGGKLYTVEGNGPLYKFARDLAKKEKINNIEFLYGNFDEVLPDLLITIPSVDLVYIDGNHTLSATLNYFEMILPFVNQNTVLVFDDIYWSREMTRAWKQICDHASVKMSIDLFEMGLIFFKPGILEKRDLKLKI
jgi:predicted O-methyltransferase YrrM